MLPRLILISLLVLAGVKPSSATHIWGGELSYELQSYDTVMDRGYYQFTMRLYRQCTGIHEGCGLAQPLADFDSIIFVTIYDSNELEIYNMMMSIELRDTLENFIYGGCQYAAPSICVEKAVYQESYWLDNIPGGYTVNYQRCCRTWDIVNLVLPPCPTQPILKSDAVL